MTPVAGPVRSLPVIALTSILMQPCVWDAI
jgi:hypothetical protein